MTRSDGIGFSCEASVQTPDRPTSLTNKRQDGGERGGETGQRAENKAVSTEQEQRSAWALTVRSRRI